MSLEHFPSARWIYRWHPITPPSKCAAVGRVGPELVGLPGEGFNTRRHEKAPVGCSPWCSMDALTTLRGDCAAHAYCGDCVPLPVDVDRHTWRPIVAWKACCSTPRRSAHSVSHIGRSVAGLSQRGGVSLPQPDWGGHVRCGVPGPWQEDRRDCGAEAAEDGEGEGGLPDHLPEGDKHAAEGAACQRCHRSREDQSAYSLMCDCVKAWINTGSCVLCACMKACMCTMSVCIVGAVRTCVPICGWCFYFSVTQSVQMTCYFVRVTLQTVPLAYHRLTILYQWPTDVYWCLSDVYWWLTDLCGDLPMCTGILTMCTGDLPICTVTYRCVLVS